MRYPLFLIIRDVPDLAIDCRCVVFGSEDIQQWPRETANVFAVTGPRQRIAINFAQYSYSIISPFRDVDLAVEARRRMSERLKQAWLSCVGSELVNTDSKIGPTLWASLEEQSLTVVDVQCEAQLKIRHPAELPYGVHRSNYAPITELNDDELMASRGFKAGDRIPCYVQNGCGLLELLQPLARDGAFRCHLQVCSEEPLDVRTDRLQFVYTCLHKGKLPKVLAALTDVLLYD